VTTVLAVAAHVAGGGARPGPGTIALSTVLVALGCHRLVHRERSYPALLAMTGATQVGLHVVLLDPAGQDHGVQDHTGHQGRTGAAMVLAHAVAVLLVTWWLRRGEAATWHALRRVLPAFRGWVPALVPAGTRGLPALVAPVPFPGRLVLLGLPGRRGPPRG
jgi:hypothetical protein